MADLSLTVPVNTNTQKSTYELSVSNTPLSGIESIVSSLAQYPYGCIEQSVSSTLPNAILLHFSDILHVDISKEIIEKNLKDGIERLR
ncbi:MAG: hypothetical protein H6767_00650 [Candidatus Peribacteria bacterium]|nr:MAG: hypothetical protein H6767_00650 [Candidatus Peribacteria bacterium]